MNASSSLGMPRRSVSSFAVPTARTLPAFINEMRSHRSASFMKWVERKIVTPSSRDRLIRCAPEAVAGDRIDARSRLVQDQHLRTVYEGDGQLQALFLTEGQAFGPAVRDAEQIEPFEHFLNPSRSPVLGQVKQVGMQFQVLPDGQFAIERECLRHVADAFACRHVAGIEVTPEKQRFSFGRRQVGR